MPEAKPRTKAKKKAKVMLTLDSDSNPARYFGLAVGNTSVEGLVSLLFGTVRGLRKYGPVERWVSLPKINLKDDHFVIQWVAVMKNPPEDG